MRVLIVYDVPGWAYHNRALALLANAPSDMEVTIAHLGEEEFIAGWEEYDLVFQLDYTAVIQMQRTKPGPPIVVSFNADEHRRHGMMRQVRSFADFVVCNNHGRWVWEGRPQRTCNISNGVDTDFFRITRPITERPKRLLWVGSTGRNKHKGWQEVIAPMENACLRRGWDCDFRPCDHVSDAMSREEMVEWYNRGSLVLCASESDATPNTTLEGMACGCVPLTTWVGNIREFGADGMNCVVAGRSPGEFVAAAERAFDRIEDLSQAARESVESWSWTERSMYFWALFRKIASRGPAGVEPFSYRDKHWSDV